MSGIVGIIGSNREPVSGELLGQLTNYLAFRGPDAQQSWNNGVVGLGHTLLNTGRNVPKPQPLSLNGTTWISADVRLDDRVTLISKLMAKSAREVSHAEDAELLLHAYAVWGENCVEHLLGEFAFAIWDDVRGRLFCARDQFGVKPFFYAALKDSLVFSNTLNCLRLHPEVPNDLNDLSVADFLLFGYSQEKDTTIFAKIKRLPPAHTLLYSPGSLVVRRYWTLTEPPEIRYRRKADYVEHFKAIFDEAVSDRLSNDRVAMLLSGGLDSANIAASLDRLRQSTHPQLEVRCLTYVFNRLIADEEKYYARMIAQKLNLSQEPLVVDDIDPFIWLDESELPAPEPDEVITPEWAVRALRHLSSHARIAFNGQGGDETFRYETGRYLAARLRGLQFGRLFQDLRDHAIAQGRLPRLGVRTALKNCIQRAPHMGDCGFPDWLQPDLVRRFDLLERWRSANNKTLNNRMEYRGPRREAIRRLTSPRVASMLFERRDPGITRCPVEVRFPFLDLRVVKYILALPALPWCFCKELERMALGDRIAQSVRSRPKTPMADNPVFALLRQQGETHTGTFEPVDLLRRYVDVRLIKSTSLNNSILDLYLSLRPRKLNAWLRSLS